MKEYRKPTQYTKLGDFVGSLENLFSVAKCSCDLLTSNCFCGNTPLFMKSFMVDQQTDRKYTISRFLKRYHGLQ